MLKRLADRLAPQLGVETERQPWLSLVTAAAFGLALTFVHVHHELWRDEMHCWSLARNAHGLWDLLTGVRRYDGHPFLWYYLLYLVSRLSRSVVMLHGVTIVLATWSSYLWLRHAPLARVLRIPLLATYLVFFEYSVLSRSYALGLLCLFGFCRSYHRQRLRLPWLTLLLVLLAFTSAYGAMIALALAIMLYLQGFADVVRMPSGRGRTRAAFTAGGSLLLFGLGLGTAWLSSLPPADGFFAPRGILGTAALWPTVPLSYWLANFPRCNPGNGTWMVTAALGDQWSWLAAGLPWLAVAWLASWLVALRREPLVALTYGAGTAIIAAFQCYEYAGFLRHFGHYFILLIACLWLYGKQGTRGQRGWLRHALLAITLAAQMVAGAFAVRTEIALPFSGSSEAARFLRAQGLADAPLVGSFDHHVAAVAGYLDRPFRSAETFERVRSVVFHNRRWPMGMPLPIVFSVALAEAKSAGRPALLLLNRDSGGYALPDVTIESLYITAPSIVADEQFRILRVTPGSSVERGRPGSPPTP